MEVRGGCNLYSLKILHCIFDVKFSDVNYLPLKWITADSGVMIRKYPNNLSRIFTYQLLLFEDQQ